MMISGKAVTEKRLIDLLKKLVYSLFVVWLGLLAPLVYFDQFAANHHIQPYRFSLFEGRSRITAPPASVAAQLLERLAQRFTRQQDAISAHSAFPGLAHALQWSLGQIYLIAGFAGLIYLLFGRLTLAEQLAAVSADLPAPKKPPREL